jgi:hypothetical protein
MSFDLLCQAINEKRCVSGTYKDAIRHFPLIVSERENAAK